MNMKKFIKDYVLLITLGYSFSKGKNQQEKNNFFEDKVYKENKKPDVMMFLGNNILNYNKIMAEEQEKRLMKEYNEKDPKKINDFSNTANYFYTNTVLYLKEMNTINQIAKILISSEISEDSYEKIFITYNKLKIIIDEGEACYKKNSEDLQKERNSIFLDIKQYINNQNIFKDNMFSFSIEKNNNNLYSLKKYDFIDINEEEKIITIENIDFIQSKTIKDFFIIIKKKIDEKIVDKKEAESVFQILYSNIAKYLTIIAVLKKKIIPSNDTKELYLLLYNDFIEGNFFI
jgi:hypothetical protein